MTAEQAKRSAPKEMAPDESDPSHRVDHIQAAVRSISYTLAKVGSEGPCSRQPGLAPYSNKKSVF